MLRATSDANRLFRRKLFCALALSLWLPAAQGNPVGAQVVNGQVSIAQQGTTLSVTNSPGAIINWQGFSISAGETARFIQQSAASSVLNRVVGPDPSVLLGTLTSNGRVFLINPSGILVGQGARIDVAGLVASTLNLNNQDFLAGRLNFQPNAAAGAVENRGTITTPTGGSVYLVGSGVTNSGIITSPQGDVILAAGQSVKILDTSTPGVRVEITAGDNAAVNLGQIVAKSGQIGIYAATLRNSGVINADQVVRGENGRIFLKASKDVTLDAGSSISASGDAGGSVTVQAEQGTLLASGSVAATGADGKGGEVKLLGTLVGLTDHASVDASGTTGGGTVLVGGDYQGASPAVQNAWRTFVGPDATVKADATLSGDGGRVIVWSDDITRFYGSVNAKGGPISGNGGFVETSSHNILDASGTVDAGAGGRWLLDPFNLTISNNATAGIGGLFDAIATGANLLATTIQTSLNLGTSVIVTTGTLGAEAGNITVVTGVNINKTTGVSATLTLQAAGNIDLQSGSTIQSTAAGNQLNLALNPGASGSANIAGTVALNGGTLSIGPSAGVVLSGGTIANATVTTTGGTGLKVSSGTLNGVTLRGVLDLSGTSSTARILNGLTLLDEAGASPGLANVTGTSASLVFDSPSTPSFNNATINLGSATTFGSLDIDGAGTLTLGPAVTVQGAGFIGGQFFVGGAATLINQGTISANLSGRTLTFQGAGVNTFTNQGTLSAQNGATLTLNPTNWTNAATGTISGNGATLNFNGNWSNAGTVNINGSTLNLGGTFNTIGIGTLTRSASTLNLLGTLDNTGQTLTLGTAQPLGVLTMNGGTILNGTVQETGGTGLAFGSGTLNGVTLRGVLDLTGTSSTARILNGLTLLTETGGPGVSNVTGPSSSLVFDSTTTASFNNATINLGSATTLGNLDIDGAGTLTLGSGVTVQGAGNIGGQFFVGGAATLINQGTISANLSGRTLTFQGNGVSTFTNQGTVQALSGATLTISATNWSNATGGTISGNGATLNLNGSNWTNATGATISDANGTVSFGGSWSNAGTVDITNSTLNLGGSFTTAGIGTLIHTGTTLNLTGTMNNTGTTLNLGTSTPLGTLNMVNGTILGGTVQENSGGLVFNTTGTLNGVTLRGDLNLTGTNNIARILNGLTLVSETGTSPGVANVTGQSATLVFDSTTTASFNNATINLGSATTLGNLDIDGAGTLTLGSGVTVQGAGNIGGQFFVGGSATLINQGTISANLSGRTLTFQGNGVSTFTNQGTVQALSGATLTISATNWSNATGGTISGNGATLNLNGSNWTNATGATISDANGTVSFGGSWSNAGTVDITNSTLNLGGSFTTAGIGTLIHTGTTLNLTGTMNNTGTTLNLGTSTPLGTLNMVNGTILGGTVQENSGGLVFNTTGTLNGVTLRGDLNLTGTNNIARILNGLTLVSETGTSPGVANVTGQSATLVFDSTTTASFNNATINLGSATTLGNLDIDGAGTLTLGSGVTVQGAGNIGGQFFVGGSATLINQGTISANLSGRTLTFQGNGVSTFTNQGTLSAQNGGTLATPSSFSTNNGIIDIGAGSVVTTNNTSLVNAATGIIRGSGTLRLVNAGVTTTRALTNNGTLEPGGGSATGTLTIIGDLVLGATSVLQIEIQGTTAGAFDAIAVNGNGQPGVGGAATLGGQLNVAHLAGFTPSGNTPFTILTYVSRVGTTDFTVSSPSGFSYTGAPGLASYIATAQAAPPNVWQGGLTGDWNVAANWSLGHVPTVTEDVQITLQGATITITAAGQAVRNLTDAETLIIVTGGSLAVGSTLTIASGGTLNNAGTLSANSLVVSGTLNTSGVAAVTGAFSNLGTINIASAGLLALNAAATNAGVINIALGGALVTSNAALTNAATGTIAGYGVVNLGTGTLTNQGTLRTGGSPGTLTIVGNLVLTPTSVVQVGIQSPGQVAGTDYDLINVSGAATLDGTLSVTQLGGFTPPGGATFQLMTFASRTGNFASISAGGLTYTGTPGASNFAIALQALLQNIFLVNAGNNSWDVATNWSLGHVPTPGEDAVIPAGVPFTVIIISAPGDTALSLTSQQNVTIASTGALTLGGGTSSVSGALTVAGGALTNNGALTTNSFALNGGAYNGSGNLTVTNAFSHTGGAFNTTGAVAITQATGNLTLTQPLSAGPLTINVPTGDLTVQDALVSSTGAMNIAVLNNLNVTAVGAATELHADGVQTIIANGINVQGASTGSNRSAVISSASAQNITVGASGITIAGGAGGSSNFAMIEQDGVTGDQVITVNGGGTIALTGGGGGSNSASIENFGRAQTISFTASGSLVLQGGSGASFSEADVTNFGDTATSQSIQFAGGGLIRLTGGTVGSDNFAEILAFTGNQTVAGNPDITLTGGASGGAANHGNSADISMGLGSGLASSTAVQTINAHNLTLQGGAGGVENLALIGASVPGQRQIINATGAVALVGGTGGTDTGAVIGNPGAVTWGPFGDVSITLNSAGPITLASGGGAVGADGLGGRALIGAVGAFRADVSVNGQSGVSLAAGTLVGSDAGAGTITVNSGAGNLAVDGAIKTTGSIALTAPDLIVGTGSIDAGAGSVTITSSAANGAVSLGAGLSGLGLSNAELARISAGTLIVNGGAIVTDGNVSVSGIAQVALAGGSVQVGNSVTVSGDLAVLAGGDVTISAGSAPVLVQANNIAIAANNLSLNGGTAADAFAAIQASTGNVNVIARGALSLTGGSLVDSDAWIVANGNISVTASFCTGCTMQLPSISPAPWTDAVVDAGLAANGTITVLLSGGQQNQVAQQVIADTNRNLPPPPPAAPPAPVVDAGGAQAAAAPTLTDPNGTVGGQSGSFGGSESGSSESGAAGSGSGGQTPAQGGKRAPAKKANARC